MNVKDLFMQKTQCIIPTLPHTYRTPTIIGRLLVAISFRIPIRDMPLRTRSEHPYGSKGTGRGWTLSQTRRRRYSSDLLPLTI